MHSVYSLIHAPDPCSTSFNVCVLAIRFLRLLFSFPLCSYLLFENACIPSLKFPVTFDIGRDSSSNSARQQNSFICSLSVPPMCILTIASCLSSTYLHTSVYMYFIFIFIPYSADIELSLSIIVCRALRLLATWSSANINSLIHLPPTFIPSSR